MRAALWILPVLALATLVRGVRIAEVAAAPDFAQPAVDAGFHDWWARSAAGVELAVVPGRDAELLERPYLRPPGYPLFLAGVYRVFGPGYLAPRVVQAVLGLCSVCLLWSIGRRAFGELAGVLAALGLATHWGLVYFEGELQATALLVLLLLAATRGLQRWAEEPRSRRALGVGLLLGLAVLVRPNALFFAGLALGWSLWVARRQGARCPPTAAALAAGLALAIAPVALRNTARGDFLLVSSNAGINLFIGNNPRADGFVAAHLEGIGPFETCFDYPEIVRRVERRTGRPMRDSEVSRWFARRAVDWMRSDPGACLRLLGRKTLLFFGPHVVGHNKELAVERARSTVLRRLPGPFPALFGLALAGLAAVACRPARASPPAALETALLAGGAVAVWSLSVVPFFVAERYRAPIYPFLILLAAAGLAEAVAALRTGRPRRAAGVLGGALVLSLLASWSPYQLAPDPAKWHLDRGRALRRAGEDAAAVAELRSALAADPDSLSAHRSLGDAMAAAGRPRQAVEHYQTVLERRPNDAHVLQNLGAVLGRLGEDERAVELLERALPRSSDPAGVHFNLALLHERAGRPERARAHLRAALEERPGWPAARGALRRLESGAAPADDAPSRDPR